MKKLVLLVGLYTCLVIASAYGEQYRSRAALNAFQHTHPCPSTGLTHPFCMRLDGHRYCHRCPGYVIDHIWALCKGGPDVPANLQWQDIATAKAKDRWECK